jgi:cytochrome c-type biogenesis protein CcmH/NrfG
VALAPANADARMALGAYLFSTGRADAATAEWEAGLELRPDSCELLYDVALGRATKGSRMASAEAARRFLAMCTNGYDAQRVSAQAWVQP